MVLTRAVECFFVFSFLCSQLMAGSLDLRKDPFVQKSHSEAKQSNCSNFAGKWVGTCTAKNGNTTKNFSSAETFQQYYCELVDEIRTSEEFQNPIHYIIGGTDSFVRSNQSTSWGITTLSNWSVGRDVLYATLTGFYRELGDKGVVLPAKGNITIKLEGANLKTYSMYDNGVRTHEETCTYFRER